MWDRMSQRFYERIGKGLNDFLSLDIAHEVDLGRSRRGRMGRTSRRRRRRRRRRGRRRRRRGRRRRGNLYITLKYT